MTTITKAAAKTALGFTSDDQLAEVLERTRQTVNKWDDDRVLEAPYRWMLWGKFPRKFPKPESRRR